MQIFKKLIKEIIWTIIPCSVCPLMDANRNLLVYRWHRSICYTRLFTTPLVVITVSLLQWVLTLWCLVSERSLDLFSVLSSISVCPECWQLTDWLLSLFFLSGRVSRCLFSPSVSYLCLSPLKSSVCVWNRRHLFSQLYFPLQQSGCLRNA
jgi:hypothetical protein